MSHALHNCLFFVHLYLNPGDNYFRDRWHLSIKIIKHHDTREANDYLDGNTLWRLRWIPFKLMYRKGAYIKQCIVKMTTQGTKKSWHGINQAQKNQDIKVFISRFHRRDNLFFSMKSLKVYTSKFSIKVIPYTLHTIFYNQPPIEVSTYMFL